MLRALVLLIAILATAASARADQSVRLPDPLRLADATAIASRHRAEIATVPQLAAACLEAAAKRVRPMLMTVLTNVFGLLPILLGDGVGSDVAKRIAAPMWGGLVTLTLLPLLTLLVIPAIYVVWRSFHLPAPTPPTGTLGEPR